MAEHLAIARAMQAGDAATVAKRMLGHLKTSRPKVIERLAAFRRAFKRAPVPYIG